MNTDKDNNILFSTSQLEELISITKIGCWIWYLKTGRVTYSKEWAEIVGYELHELLPSVKTWESMLLPADLEMANLAIANHVSGKVANYEAEFRMVRKDGTIIWGHDKGRVTEFDTYGSPLVLCGVLQDITQIKNTEMKLRESQEILNLAINVAEFGTWDWNIPGNTIRYNDAYLNMLGYKQEEISGSMAEWEGMNHPDELPFTSKMLDDYISGKTGQYECEIRMRRKDGRYIWTRDVGQISERDEAGVPIRLIGGHLNIDNLKQSQFRLSDALKQLKNSRDYLEKQVEIRTKTLVEQDKMLLSVNSISQQLVAANNDKQLNELIIECMEQLGRASNRNRMSIWRNMTIDERPHCYLAYEWNSNFIQHVTLEDIQKAFDPVDLELLTGGMFKNEQRDLFYQTVLNDEEVNTYRKIDYENHIPTFYSIFSDDKALNALTKDLTVTERFYLGVQNIKSVLVSPIYINGEPWGFIAMDDSDEEKLFSEVEEKMLSISGSLLANAIQKTETDEKIREAEKRSKIMLDATPLCFNLWTKDLVNTECNKETARLFDLADPQEYLTRFYELSPETQPCGRLSSELSKEYINKAFAEGYVRFEWLHQKFNGEPIPTEITLVRVEYKNEYVVAGYTRDLREFNAMLADIKKAEIELRQAHEEALLSSKAKTNFLANMSHEIRTPMNAIMGMSEIILRDSHDNAISEYASGIKNACGNLLAIINDILDISKIESGKLEVFNAEYNLTSLLYDIINIARMRLENKPMMFLTYIDSTLPARLIGDEIRIKQILTNILSNAIKFTASGYVALRVTGDYSDGKLHISFEISDTGAGITDDDIQRLFIEFERINSKKNRSIEGTGLGLAISKRLCEMMDGTIAVKSVVGGGSTFTIELPQEYFEYVPVAAVTAKKSVLVYESRNLYQSYIKETLSNLGVEFVVCKNQSELYEHLTERSYDYIFTPSIHLAKVQSLKEKNNLTTKVVLLADFGDGELSNKIYVVTLPVNCIQVVDVLNDTKLLTHAKTVSSQFIAPDASILIVDDNIINLQVARGLMEPYRCHIETALSGAIAVEMVRQHKFDIIFMDHMMPEMDGIDTTTAIRKLEGEYYKHLPIVALTANAIVGMKELFIQEGMDDFLAKPMEINKLNSILAKWLPKEKQQFAEKNTKHNDADDTIKIEGVDTNQGVRSIGGNVDHYVDILNIYYADGFKRHIAVMDSYKSKNLSRFKTEVHALKSASASIGAQTVSIKAQKLEEAAHKADWIYIDSYVDDFLNSFNTLLTDIERYIKPSNQNDAAKTKGDVAMLSTELDKLAVAVKFANIAEIDLTLEFIFTYGWREDISTLLRKISQSITSFDYDGALPIIKEIQIKLGDGK